MTQQTVHLVEILLVGVTLPYILSGLYLVVLSVVALIAERRQSDWRSDQGEGPRNDNVDGKGSGAHGAAGGACIHFVVMIPAHNEEAVLAETLQSVKKLEYPSSYVDIVVIADNCTDATADIARKEGVYVLERTHPVLRGKGYALKWGFNAILDHIDPDAVVVLDADSTISSNALAVLQHDLREGHEIVQLLDLVQNRPGSWSLQMSRLGFFLFNYIRPMARRQLGLSITLRGNGMCFSSNVLKEHGWTTFSQAEDLDYSLYLLHHGHRVHFEPQAEVLAQMPVRARDAVTQRIRWESGRSVFRREYGPLFLKSLFKKGDRLRWSKLDTLIELSIPPLMNLVISVVVVFTSIALFSGWLYEQPALNSSAERGVGTSTDTVSASASPFDELSWMLIVMIPAGPLLLLLHIVLGLSSRRSDPGMWNALLFTPLYLLWKVRVMLTSLVQRIRRTGAFGNEWIRTSRLP